MSFKAKFTDTGYNSYDSITNNNHVSLTGLSADQISRTWVSIDGGAKHYLSSSDFSLLEGTHSYTFGLDKNSIESSSPYTFCYLNQSFKATLITATPSALGISLVDTGLNQTDHITNNGQISITGAKDGAQIQYQVDGSSWKAINYFGLTPQSGSITAAEGTHQYNVRQVDQAGNISTISSLNVTLDTAGPSNIHVSTSTDKTHLVFSANEDIKGVSYQVLGYGSKLFDESSFDKLAQSSSGPLRVTAKLTDTAGNSSTTEQFYVQFDQAHQHIAQLTGQYGSHLVV